MSERDREEKKRGKAVILGVSPRVSGGGVFLDSLLSVLLFVFAAAALTWLLLLVVVVVVVVVIVVAVVVVAVVVVAVVLGFAADGLSEWYERWDSLAPWFD